MDLVLALALTLATIPQAPASSPALGGGATAAQLERLIKDGKADDAAERIQASGQDRLP